MAQPRKIYLFEGNERLFRRVSRYNNIIALLYLREEQGEML